MNKYFFRNVRVTASFFMLRLVCAVLVGFIYIILAALVQDVIVRFLGESTFNYIVAGIMSLFLGIWFCYFIGSIFFMFVKGWHVAALAYVPKIVKSGASALDVGIRAFSKNLISFGAVYGVRVVFKNTVKDFKDKIWTLSSEIPYAATLKNVADNPIVEYIASDVLHYAFDATVFYLVKHPAKDINDVPSVVFKALQKYLYSLPSILISSVQTYICFRFIPKLIKWCVVFYIFFTEGIVAGLLISVLMLPIFYILDNAVFDPLTMVVFISAYAKQCDKEVDEESPIVKAVNAVLEGMSIGTSSVDFENSSDDGRQDESSESNKKLSKKIKHTKMDSAPVTQELPPDDDLFDDSTASDSSEVDLQHQAANDVLGALSRMATSSTGFRMSGESTVDLEELPLDGQEDEEREIDVSPARAPTSLSDLFRGLHGGDLDDDPLQGMYVDSSGSIDRAQSLLSGDEDE